MDSTNLLFDHYKCCIDYSGYNNLSWIRYKDYVFATDSFSYFRILLINPVLTYDKKPEENFKDSRRYVQHIFNYKWQKTKRFITKIAKQ